MSGKEDEGLTSDEVFESLLSKKITPPWVPPVEKGFDNTDLFEDYPDSDEIPAIVNPDMDPFRHGW